MASFDRDQFRKEVNQQFLDWGKKILSPEEFTKISPTHDGIGLEGPEEIVRKVLNSFAGSPKGGKSDPNHNVV